eukprot:jgi/Galph1/1187/GphlegSOOS_G6026.1
MNDSFASVTQVLIVLILGSGVWWTARVRKFAKAAVIDRIALLGLITLGAIKTLTLLHNHHFVFGISFTKVIQFFLAGGICACITHAAFVPLDVIKTRLQTNPEKYNRLLPTMKQIYEEEGFIMLFQGFSATAFGYFLHGALKFSCFEAFKAAAGVGKQVETPLLMFIVSSVSSVLAECVASLFLCPMEAVRIRLVAEPSFAQGIFDGLPKMWKLEGRRGLFKGIPYMLLKQIPFTYGQFVSFEVLSSYFRNLSVSSNQSEQLDLRISLFCGLISGVVAAVISHPGDTLLSLINRECSEIAFSLHGLYNLIRRNGTQRLFSGLGVRVILVGCMLGGQFLIYDSLKAFVGILSPVGSKNPAISLPEISVKT